MRSGTARAGATTAGTTTSGTTFTTWSAGSSGSRCRPRRSAPPRCGRSTAAGRSTRAGTRIRAWSATWPTSTGSPAPWPSCRDRLDHLAELGVRYLHLMPLLAPRAEPNDGGYAVRDYRAVDPRLGTMDDLEAAGRGPARAGHEPVHRSRAQPHRTRAPVGAGLAGRRPAVRGLLHRLPRPHDARRLRADDRRRVPASRRRGRSPGSPKRSAGPAAGCGPRSSTYQWDLDYAQAPGVRRRCSTRSCGWPTGVWRSSGWTRCRSCGSGSGTTCIEPARGPRAHAGAARAGAAGRARHGVQGRGDRLARGPRALPRRRTPGTGRSASWPTTTS